MGTRTDRRPGPTAVQRAAPQDDGRALAAAPAVTVPTARQDDLARARIRREVEVRLRGGDPRITGRVITFDGLADGREHIAIGLGPARCAPLVRIHSECLTGDVFGSARCDCGSQLQESVDLIHERGGYILYLRQEGRGIGLYSKLDAYALQDGGLDTFAANRALGFDDDERSYLVAGQMLAALGCRTVDLLTNNPDKVRQLRCLGLVVREVVGTGQFLTADNAEYLAAKAGAGHTGPASAT